jgi:hypothetical protein
MKSIEGYQHRVAAHCETGTVCNLLRFAGLELSEPVAFGLGSGPAFYYLFFAKGPSTFPLVGIRNRPGGVVSNLRRRLAVDLRQEKPGSPEAARPVVDRLLDQGRPVAVCVDMYYMKYLPVFQRVHAPFHFILLVGRDGDGYLVSDPYAPELNRLEWRDLQAAWATGAPLSQDNYLAYLRRPPAEPPWAEAALTAIKATCQAMLLPPVVNRLLFFAGIEGMRAYARALVQWPHKYAGAALREGVLFNAVGFEDQGTGGGAFRIMYGAFLQEVAPWLSLPALSDLGKEMAAHGQRWRQFSLQLVKIGKKIPAHDDQYDSWLADQGPWLAGSLREASHSFLALADAEERLLSELQRCVAPREVPGSWLRNPLNPVRHVVRRGRGWFG